MNENNLTNIPASVPCARDESKFMDNSALNDFFRLDSNRQRQESYSERFGMKVL